MNKKNLAGWFFQFNPYRNVYEAAKRENAHLLNNDASSPLILRSSKFETLEELICLTNGDEDKIKKLLKNG